MTKALRVPDYLGHILKAIERIDRYSVPARWRGAAGKVSMYVRFAGHMKQRVSMSRCFLLRRIDTFSCRKGGKRTGQDRSGTASKYSSARSSVCATCSGAMTRIRPT